MQNTRSRLGAVVAVAIALLIAACGDRSAETGPNPAVEVKGGRGQVESDLHTHIAVLADDRYEGREPGTAGEEKTVAYISREFDKLGLKPANDGDWFQLVPISSVTTSPDAVLALRGDGFSADLVYGRDMVVSTQRQVPSTALKNSELVFVGYGINAPERNWNDYDGLDVAGKTVVILVNDPGYATQDPELFNGNTMTYYGRWIYKYEEAARQGAAGAIIVHETAPASYPWAVVENSWSGAQIGLTDDNKHRDKLAVEAWIPVERARELFAAAGLSFEQSKSAAQKDGFTPQPLGGITASVSMANTVEENLSRNVMGMIEGSEYPDEVIIYTAHWDHLGVRPDQEGDNIYNGASDNASGVAGLMALARLFQEKATPQRSVMFLAVTAEESGLLGSKWYAQNPVFAPEKTIANFNMDNIAAGNIGPTRDIAVVGYGNSELENYLVRAAEKQGRTVVQEPNPEKGFYYRSDHFNFAKIGVPALYLTRSTDSVEHGKQWGQSRLNEYTAKHYHKPSDEYAVDWDLRGAAQEMELLFHMVDELANSRDFPNWNQGVEFKSERDESLAFKFKVERFADIQMLRYQVPGWDQLSPQQKELLYYLYQASYSGRDIIWDQNYKHNLRIRRTLEAVVRNYKGDINTVEFDNFMVYARRVWFANGIHHHYSTLKFQPEFSRQTFARLVLGVSDSGQLPLREGQSPSQLVDELTPILFDPDVAPKKVNTASGVDKVVSSAVNFYEGVTEAEVRAFYAASADANDPEPISFGLNSKLVKNANGELEEQVYRIGGMYSAALERVVYWLGKAITVAENDKQRRAFELLVKYYRSGDLKDFDDYSVAWVEDTDSSIDAINGFIEVYNDPIAYRGSWESVVFFRDPEATRRIATIGDEAQWFEDNSPIMDAHKRKNVKGILARGITVVAESGDASPSTPVGINLPNANWIRATHGSKSVSLGNLVAAYGAVRSGQLEEFAWDQVEIDRALEHRLITGKLHTDMHEVIGHASGQINPGVGTPKETLKQYSSVSEEARADLVALYFVMDPKLIELGVMPSLETGKAQYDGYIRNGLMTQLQRLQPGEQLEQAHMRNRSMVTHWAMDMGKEEMVIERRERDGQTYFVINDYDKLRAIFGRQLRELQRVKSEGDFERIKQLVETFGTRVDADLHEQVLARVAKLDKAPYSGFVNPVLEPVMDGDKIIDVNVVMQDDFVRQMLYYADNYSFLPDDN